MSKDLNKPTIDLRGIMRLAVDAVIGATESVESFSGSIRATSVREDNIGSSGGFKPQSAKPAFLLSILNKVRLITCWTGDKMERPLELANRLLAKNTLSPKREALLSAINGVLGDHLLTTNNPLAINMQFRRSGVALDDTALKKLVEESNGNLLIMIHGSCMSDLQWNNRNHNHGEMLAKELAMTPLYLHYNSGLHISDNGKQFSSLLESITSLYSHPLQLNIVAHSMGGLVARSACHYAKLSQYSWHKQLQKLIFLGTPHHGAPLEKCGNWIDSMLSKSRYSLPFASLAKMRSSGITDLRYGNLLDQDWNKNDRFDRSGDQRQPVPLPEETQCYAIAGSMAERASQFKDKLIGDGLVTLTSALGQHKDPQHCLHFPDSHQWVGREIGHIQLLSNGGVYQQIKNWLTK